MTLRAMYSASLACPFAMPVAPNAFGGISQPSCFDRIKYGFMMGFCVGVASGAIFGGFSCLRFGLRGRELLQTVGKGMIQGGGTFGMFMAVGTAIRC
ncbi:Reactive oxygen species modulator [Fasciola hepatica]|uniref:Reactive oxygen species modulator 1 n=2 Tax=Fasciola TaxID=6191 RepID=A0A4E0REJ6_FASHE|nr:Reactive oxygen species modulator [Fasciola hepatica]